jgi:phosphatidylserine synthase
VEASFWRRVVGWGGPHARGGKILRTRSNVDARSVLIYLCCVQNKLNNNTTTTQQQQTFVGLALLATAGVSAGAVALSGALIALCWVGVGIYTFLGACGGGGVCVYTLYIVF